jgi:hypothetical protein
MLSWWSLTTACDINDALRHMNRADFGIHCMIIYPDLNTLRMLYPQYIQKQIEGNNEIVLVNPFYETAAATRLLISQANPDMDVPKREREKSLIVIDSLEEYFGERADMPFKKNLARHAEKTGRTGISILGDIGSYLYKSKHKDLVDYESSLPLKFDVPMKGFCLYHLKDFETFTDEQKQKLIQHHSKTLRILERQSSVSTFFEQPLNFVNHVKDGQHIVLFYEEIEYAKKISSEFIKSGLERNKRCTYVSDEDAEEVTRELADDGIDANNFSLNGLLTIHKAPDLINNFPKESLTNKNGLGITTAKPKPGQPDRTVFRWVNNINTDEQIESTLKWELEYRLNELKNGKTNLLCCYPVDNIIQVLSDSTGPFARWMNAILTTYDGVIFARRLWKGVGFNLD